MNKWVYTITNGKALHEAIDDGDVKATIEALKLCNQELLDKLTDEDREWKGDDIEYAINFLDYTVTEDKEEVDSYLDDFYGLCDDLRAWITL